MIGVLHAYSRENAGDSLLVDLTLERLARAGVPADEVLLVALAPDSFADLPLVRQVGTAGRNVDLSLLSAAARSAALLGSATLRRTGGSLARELARCDALVAVGGGYLRTPDLRSSVGTAVNHLAQLAVAAHSPRVSAYLPQSIGPLRGPVGAAVRRLLARVDRVWVRDEHSAAELAAIPQVARLPDLALLHLAERVPRTPRSRSGPIAMVGRDLDHVADAMAPLQSTASLLRDDVRWLVQAGGDASKSDAAFYAAHRIEPQGRLADALADDAVSVVVSVRLHGAVLALLAGVPAVHLAYDRKGPAAYADLGLARYCVDIRLADPRRVAELVEELRSDAQPFWAALDRARPTLLEASAQLDGELATLLRG